MTRMRDSILAGVIIAVTAAASSCGGSAAKPHASVSPSPAKASAPSSPGTANGAPAEPPPAGYQWAGSAAQGVWFAVPSSWAALNLAKISATKALSRLAFKGVSSSYLKTVLADLSKRHAIFVADLASAVRSPHRFATNGNAFCTPTALVPSASSSSALKAGLRAEYAKIHAHVLAIRSATIGGHPGVKADFTITSTAGLTVTEAQYVVLTKNSRLCTVTLSTDKPTVFRRTFSKIGGTIRVS
jgi:hypothetical protein